MVVHRHLHGSDRAKQHGRASTIFSLTPSHVSFGHSLAIAIRGGGVSCQVAQAILESLRAYIVSFLSGEPQQYVGHNPVARIGITLLFLLLAVQLATGLVIAGTDLFWPPFGHWFAQWVAAPGVDPSAIQPGNTGLIDKATYQAMRAFRQPFVTVHEIAFYALIVLIGLHIVAVVITELHEGGNITSAMVTGTKVLTRRPPDAPSRG
jgi:Ni/Fe-hydrogenase 1 B-type cytochrome subunit